MSKRKVIAAVVLAAFAGFAAVAGGLVTPDVYPSLATYGVSVGGNSAYCSAELVRWVPQVSCERAS